MQIKKTSILLACILLTGITGCGTEHKTPEQADSIDNTSFVSETETENVTETEPPTEPTTEALTEPPTEPFRSESDHYLGADMGNIKSGGTVAEDENSIYFVDVGRASVWGQSEEQLRGHICKYDKASRTCGTLTGTGWDKAFFSPTYNTPLKSLNLSEDGYIYALCFNNNTYMHEIIRVDAQTGEAQPFYTPKENAVEMLLVGDQLIYTTEDGQWGYGGINTLKMDTKRWNAISHTDNDAPEGRGYADYSIAGVFGDKLYYVYTDREEAYESAEEPRMCLESYSLSTREKESIPLLDESGNDCSECFDADTLMCMGEKLLSVKDDELYIFDLSTKTAEHKGSWNGLTGSSEQNYKGKAFLDGSLYLMRQDLDNGVRVNRLSEDVSGYEDFYSMNSIYMNGTSIYHMEKCSFGRADGRILMATEDRMMFLSADGTETVLDFDD